MIQNPLGIGTPLSWCPRDGFQSTGNGANVTNLTARVGTDFIQATGADQGQDVWAPDRKLVMPGEWTTSGSGAPVGYTMTASIPSRAFTFWAVLENDFQPVGGTIFQLLGTPTLNFFFSGNQNATDRKIMAVGDTFGISSNLPNNCCVLIVRGNASNCRFRIDDVSTDTAVLVNQTFTACTVGKPGQATTQINLLDCGIFGSAITDGQMDDLSNCLAFLYGIQKTKHHNVVISGDSKDFGLGQQTGQSAMRQWNIAPDVQVHNLGWPGRRVTAMLAGYASEIAPLYDGSKTSNILLLPVPFNDFDQNSASTAAQSYADVLAISTLAKATGFTVIPRTMDNAITGNNTSTLANNKAFNNLIRSNAIANGWRFIADVGADSLIGTGATNSPTYFFDTVHRTAAGYGIAGAIESEAIMHQIRFILGGETNQTATLGFPLATQVLSPASGGPISFGPDSNGETVGTKAVPLTPINNPGKVLAYVSPEDLDIIRQR